MSRRRQVVIAVSATLTLALAGVALALQNKAGKPTRFARGGPFRGQATPTPSASASPSPSPSPSPSTAPSPAASAAAPLRPTPSPSGTRSLRYWLDPARGLSVKWTEKGHGQRGPLVYDEQATLTLQDGPR